MESEEETLISKRMVIKHRSYLLKQTILENLFYWVILLNPTEHSYWYKLEIS